MFNITSHKGFHITFPNGWTVSVQWGPGNYCDARKSGLDAYDAPKRTDEWMSATAEIAAWDAKNNWYDFGNDTVKGHCSPDEVLEFMNMISEK